MRGKGSQRGVKGSEGAKEQQTYSILGFRVPTTSVGAWDEGGEGE